MTSALHLHVAGKLAVDFVDMNVVNQSASIVKIDQDLLKQQLPLPKGATCTIPIEIAANS